jgi:LysM repeat protein
MFVLSYSHRKEIPVRIIGLFLSSILMLSACSSDGGQLPTGAGLPASTKTLIPTQSQQLTTPTLPGTIEVADSQANNSNLSNDDVSAPTDTPIDCNVQDDWEIYTVKRGDNLANIATSTGSTIDELTQANCIDNPNRIRVGQELYVPNAPDLTGIASTELVSTTIAPASIVTVTTAPTITVSAQDATQPSFSVSINKTFESEIGFGLDIPMEWFITESTTPTVENAIITSFEYTLGDEIPQNRWSDDMVSITVTVFQETTTESLSQWAQSVVNQFQSASNIADVFAPVTLFTDSEIEGQSIDYISADDTVVRNYYFIINNHRVQISVGGNFDMAVPVVNSLN